MTPLQSFITNENFIICNMYDEYSKSSSIGVISFDVNFLKRTNDIEGHAAGDTLIQKAAKSIRIASFVRRGFLHTPESESCFQAVLASGQFGRLDFTVCRLTSKNRLQWFIGLLHSPSQKGG